MAEDEAGKASRLKSYFEEGSVAHVLLSEDDKTRLIMDLLLMVLQLQGMIQTMRRSLPAVDDAYLNDLSTRFDQRFDSIFDALKKRTDEQHL